MDLIQAREILSENIKKNLFHEDYPRTVKLAEKYKTLITGKDISKLLARFNPRESKELFDQRVALTIAITPEIVGSLMKPFYKVPRTTPISAKYEPLKGSAKEVAVKAIVEMNSRIKDFYGSDTGMDGLDYFLQNRFVELSFSDPNSWIVIEFDPFDPLTEKPTPRPFEVSSENAINFKIKNNRVEWLIVQDTIKMITNEGKIVEGKKYTIYGDNVAVVFEQTKSDRADPKADAFAKIEENNYNIFEFETMTGKVPAFRVGYVRDLETDARTFVSPFALAMPTLDKSIKQVSEYDLSHCLHVFPQKIVRLVKSCPGVPGDSCRDGRLRDGTICGTCKGTGRAVHTTAQDIIEVELPETVKEEGFVPLSEMVHYVDLPVELLKFQKECIDEFLPKSHQAVFNTTVLAKSSFNGAPVAGNKTAFEVDNDVQSVYDTLSPFADKYSATWVFIVEMIAVLLDVKETLNIIHRFPSKFGLKTREQIYQEFDFAVKSGLPSFMIDTLSEELAETVFMDDAQELIKFNIKNIHFPFKGKTKEEILILLSSENVLRETKVLYSYFEDIFTEIERENDGSGVDFFIMSFVKQKEIIDAKVAEIIEKLDAAKVQASPFSMGGAEDQIDDGEEDDPNQPIDPNPDPNQ